MLKNENRLKSRKEINMLFRGGGTVSCERWILKYLKSERREKQVAFSVGVKFSKKATERNRVKRWMRESARAMLGQIKDGSKIMFIVSAGAPADRLDYKKTKHIMENLLRKANLI